MNDIARKWDVIYRNLAFENSPPAAVLEENAFLLPMQGEALDLACGLGGNARFLATLGLSVSAWDISAVAIEKLQAQTHRQGLAIDAERRVIDANSLIGRHFDVIVISRFLDRTLSDAIISALKPGGLLFYQTFTQEKVSDSGPTCSHFLLREAELLGSFAALKAVYYRDNGRIGNCRIGLRNEAQFIGQKR